MYKKIPVTSAILLSALGVVKIYSGEIQVPYTEDKPLSLTADQIARLSPVMQKLRSSMAEIVLEGKKDPFATALQSDAIKSKRKKAIALDSAAQAARWTLAAALLKASSDLTAPYIQGILSQYAPNVISTIDSLLARVPENLTNQQAACIAAASVGIVAGARHAFKALSEPEALNFQERQIVIDFDTTTRTRHDLTIEALKGLWTIETVAEGASQAINEELETLGRQQQALVHLIETLEANLNQSARETAEALAAQSAELKDFLVSMHSINELHGQMHQQPVPSEAVTVQARQVEKRNRKISGFAALGLGILHKKSNASTRGINDDALSPMGILALGCAATLGVADYAQKTLTAQCCKALREEFRENADKNLQEAKDLIRESSWNVFAQDDLDTQVLAQKVSLLDAALDRAHDLLAKIKAHKLTEQEMGGNNQIVQQHTDLVKTAQSIVTKFKSLKKQ